MKKLLALSLLLLSVFILASCEEEIIPDTNSPVITLLGENEIFLNIGDDYIDPGFMVDDDFDLDPTTIVSGPVVDSSSPNMFIFYYNAFDDAGNVANEVERRVYVINNEPGIIASFTYESIDLIGVSIMTFDVKNILVDLYANLYDGDTLIESVEITELSQSFQFTGLETGIDYTLLVEGNYEFGIGDMTGPFSKEPISVGVYKRISEDLRTEIDNDIKFDALKELVYLPYDSSNYSKTIIDLKTLSNIDEGILVMFSELEYKIIFSNTWVNSLYEFFEVRDGPNFPGFCCEPAGITIGYTGTSISITLRTMGELFNYTNGHSTETLEFLDVFIVEAALMFPDSFYGTVPYSYFAEAFAYYFYSDVSNQELLETAPLTYQYLETLFSDTIQAFNQE